MYPVNDGVLLVNDIRKYGHLNSYNIIYGSFSVN